MIVSDLFNLLFERQDNKKIAGITVKNRFEVIVEESDIQIIGTNLDDIISANFTLTKSNNISFIVFCGDGFNDATVVKTIPGHLEVCFTPEQKLEIYTPDLDLKLSLKLWGSDIKVNSVQLAKAKMCRDDL